MLTLTLRTRVLLGLAVLCAGSSALADVVFHAREGAYEGQIRPVENDDSQVEINKYWSKHKSAKYGTQRIAKELIKKQIVKKRPQQDYHDRALALKADDAAGHAALATWCKKSRRKHEALYHAQLALTVEPDNPVAKKILGSGKTKKFLKYHAEYTAQVLPLIDELLKIEPKAEDTDEQIAAIKGRLKGLAGAPSGLTVDRLFRSQQARRGLFKVQGNGSGISDSGPLKMRMDVGGLRRSNFALFVPNNYDPRKSYPLILGLHGGGPGPKPEDDPVGSGSSTITFYISNATKREYIIVCPDAIAAPWSKKPNAEFIDKLIREMVLTYNVDLRRVYVMGHSMGGYGSWAHGPRLCDSIAAFSPNSGASGNGMSKLVKTRTAVYMYHGNPDPRCSVDSAKAAANSMLKAGVDFIYTELDGTGHKWPGECITDSFDLFDRRRTYATGAKLVFAHPTTRGFKLPPGIAPVPSLHVLPLCKAELTDLGGIASKKKKQKKATKAGDAWKALWANLQKGGAISDEAAAAFKGLKAADTVKAVKPLIGLLTHEKEDTRRTAATALAHIGDAKALKALGAAATEKQRPVRRSAIVALGTFATIDGPGTLAQLTKVLRWQGEWFKDVTGGDRIRANNWQWNLEELQLIFTAAAPVADAEFLGLVNRIAVQGMAQRTLDIPWDKVAHKDPKVVRQWYAAAIAKFAGEAGVTTAANKAPAEAILGELESDARFRDVSSVTSAISKARAALKQ